MMQQHMKQANWIGLLVLFAILVAACGSPSKDAGKGGDVPDSISCEVYYRPSAGASLSGSTLTLSTSGDQQIGEFDDLRFEAKFLSDVGEGKSLSIAVTELNTGDEVTRALYQIDQGKGLADQFIGGHGFTGLVYVFHPSSDGELQYFCLSGTAE